MTSYSIPTEALNQHIAIVGKTGSGKTSTEKLCAEQVVEAGFRVCVLDAIKSDWWGITSSASGKEPGLPFKILGGPRGHVPLHSSAGQVIGQLVGSGKLPLSIIDMADFEAGGLQRFFVEFAPALMRSARGVLYLVIEEAHEFAPKERAGIGAENLTIHWAKKLATAGRSKGIRLIVATQRIQSLHNAVLGSCETVIAHRLTTPADQEPIVKWLKANTDKQTQERVASSLSSLPTGTGWLCSGEARIFERVAFPKFKTFDNTATPTGDGADVAVKTATVDHEELRALIGDAVREAEENDPKALKAELARLRGGLQKTAQNSHEPNQSEIEKAEKRGYERGYAEGADAVRQQVIPTVQELAERFFSATEAVMEAKQAVKEFVEGWRMPVEPPTAPPRPAASSPPKSMPRARPVPETSNGAPSTSTQPDGDLSGSAAQMLDVLVVCHPWAISALLWGAFARRSPVSGSWHKAVGELRTAGLVLAEGGKFVATEKALATSAAKPAGISSDVDLWAHFRDTVAEIVGGSALGLLGILAAHDPNRLTARQWGLLAGRSPISGDWHRMLKLLTKWDLIDKAGDRFGVSDKGAAVTGRRGGADTRGALHAARLARLSPPAHEIYDALPGAPKEIAKRLGKSPISGSWHAAVKELRGSGLVEEANGELRWAEEQLGPALGE